MKKRISILLITLMITLCLSVSAFAVQVKSEVSFNDNFTKMYFNGKTFSRINAKLLDYDYDLEISEEMVYDDGVYTGSSAQYNETADYNVTPNPAHTNISEIYVHSNKQQTLFFAEITYNDGATLNCSFLRDDYKAEYEKITSGKTDTLTVDFFWPDDNQVVVNANSLKNGSSEKLDYFSNTDFEVYAEASDKSFRSVVGLLFESEGNYYYFDFTSAGISYYDYLYGEESMEEIITVTKIDDEEVILALDEGMDKYYEDEMGFIFDEDFSNAVSMVFFFILLIVFPFIICIASLILFIKSKKTTYKKIFATICVLSILEIIAVVIVILLYKNII